MTKRKPGTDPVSDAVSRLSRSLQEAAPELAPLVQRHAFEAIAAALEHHGGRRHYIPTRPPLALRTEFLGLQLQRGTAIPQAFHAAKLSRTSGYEALRARVRGAQAEGSAAPPPPAPAAPARTVIDNADDFAALIERAEWLERARLEFNAMTDDGNTARFWRAFQLAREAGGELPEAFLRVLDDVAARLLAAGANDADRLRAIGFPKRRRGERDLASRASTPKRYELCSLVWLQATGGKPSGDPPSPLPKGTYEAVARRLGIALDTKTKAQWKTWWSRHLKGWHAGGAERDAVQVELAKVLRGWSGDRR